MPGFGNQSSLGIDSLYGCQMELHLKENVYTTGTNCFMVVVLYINVIIFAISYWNVR